MNPTPAATEPQPGVTPAPTNIAPALDFYDRECSRQTLSEHIAKRLKSFNPVEGMLITEWQLAKIIALAIAEYEETHSIASVILTDPGTGYTQPPTATATDGDGKPVALTKIEMGPAYRMIEAGEPLMRGDETNWNVHYTGVGEWRISPYHRESSRPLEPTNVGHYRRRITPNEPQPETPPSGDTSTP